MRANFLLALTSTLFALFIGEIALRVVGFHVEVEWTVSDIIRVEDAVLNYRLRPHSLTDEGAGKVLGERAMVWGRIAQWKHAASAEGFLTTSSRI